MTPYKHAESTAAKYGGDPLDYVEIHNWFDETKQYTGDWTHRALRHHAAGVEWAIEKFGHAIQNTNGKRVPVKMIAEQHIMEDCCGKIPTVADWLMVLAGHPADWMLKVGKIHTQKIETI